MERTNIMSGDMYSLYSRRGFLRHKRDITLLWFEFDSGTVVRPIHKGPPWRKFLDHARGTTHLWLADHRARTGLTMSSISPSVSRGRLRPSLTTRFDPAMRAMAPALLFGVRLWASGIAGALCRVLAPARRSPLGGNLGAIVCQPQLGASLRKGWFGIIENAADRLPASGPHPCFSSASHCGRRLAPASPRSELRVL